MVGPLPLFPNNHMPYSSSACRPVREVIVLRGALRQSPETVSAGLIVESLLMSEKKINNRRFNASRKLEQVGLFVSNNSCMRPPNAKKRKASGQLSLQQELTRLCSWSRRKRSTASKCCHWAPQCNAVRAVSIKVSRRCQRVLLFLPADRYLPPLLAPLN